MNNLEKKEFVKLTNVLFTESINAEEKLELDNSQFINWIIGLSSAGFLFIFSNLKVFKSLIPELKNFVSSLFIVVMITFLSTILSGLIYKISKTKLLKAYLFIRTFIGLQNSSLQNKPDKIKIETESDGWKVFSKIYDLKYLPDKNRVEKSVSKKTDTNPCKCICKTTYVICIIGFIIEFFSIFILFYKTATV